MTQVTIEQAMRIAIQHHEAGRLAEAEGIYRQVLGQQPDHFDAIQYLGILASQVGRHEAAVELFRHVAMLRPDSPEAHSNLGNALRGVGKHDEAIAAYRKAIHLRPSFSQAQSNLGVTLNDLRRFDEAVAACRQAIELKPDSAEAYNNLCNSLRGQGRLEDALAACRTAIRLNPAYAVAYNNLGTILDNCGKLDEAIAAYRDAIRRSPNYAEAYTNLGAALNDQGKLDDAVAAYRHAIQLNPANAETHNNLGNTLKIQGRLDDALACYDRAIELKPRDPAIHSNRLFLFHFHPGFDAGKIYREHRVWNEKHAIPLKAFIAPHSNDSDAERKLRVGYVSPDFREHVVGRNMLPLLREHDRERFDAICYADVVRPDALTAQFRDLSDSWRSIVGLSDDQVCAMVREDRIDILVDLTLHMGHGRLPIFARKPTPVQVTFAGYPGTTGLDAMDYRLTDPYLDRPDSGDAFYSETSIRLPESFWCYDPALITGETDRFAPVSPLPALKNGVITFGCLNNFCKVNDPVLNLWARVLHAVTGSRLLLMGPEGTARERTLETLSRAGIDPARIEFVATASIEQYLQQYTRIDIGLDTFPYNGHATSLDALWMGVPVVTLVGKTVVGRAGLSQLSNLNLTEIVATSDDQYVRIASDLAGDLPRLSALRAGLRERMRQSPLTDAPRFARNIESAYRQMWRTWCDNRRQQLKAAEAK